MMSGLVRAGNDNGASSKGSDRPRGRSNNKHAHHDAYTKDAARYDRLCRAQQLDGLFAAMRTIFASRHGHSPFGGQLPDVVDVGTGSGKLLSFLAPFAHSVVGIDRQGDILEVARRNVARAGLRNCTFARGDARALPLPPNSADVTVAGWVLCYLKAENETWDASGRSWGPWREEVDAALAEIDRVLRPGGTAIILESLGTATAVPRRLGSQYYAHLRTRGFEETVVRTDYRFASQGEAEELCMFFFGGVTAARVRTSCSDGVVPECTGVWSRRKSGAGPPASSLCMLDAVMSSYPGL